MQRANVQTNGGTSARTKSTHPHICFTSSSFSWEEPSFSNHWADLSFASGWSLRSFICTFCRREFRSAQALGGHMNIHRRDRALLNQAYSPDDEDQHQGLHSSPDNNPPVSRGNRFLGNSSGSLDSTAGVKRRRGTEEVVVFNSGKVELDLELRLGVPPKVKQSSGILALE
ncbi:hypothetical protein HPP92_018132 [Vanilla planifolia]|uniref:C2H2-type domain-containing protein n=1 Tax=Vanilla planifolia TaxID=51239 RepID=A0A835ULZ5_VANPL|nr:hypothetical protein HPP92_018132 [Vanilla planifolia]